MTRVAAIILICVTLAGAFYAVRWGFADFYADRAYQAMDQWEPHSFPDYGEWEKVEQALLLAAQLDPKHPVYHQRLSRLYRMLLIHGVHEEGTARLLAEKARAHLLISLNQRSHWAFAWAELAFLKAYLEEFDSEFDNAIQSAVAYGPWEPDVISMIIYIGETEWEQLSAKSRGLVIDAFIRGLVSPSPGLFEYSVTRLRSFSNRDPSVLEGVLPYISDTPWHRSVQLTYFLLVDAAWSGFTPDQRETALLAVIDMLVVQRFPESYTKRASNREFLLGICAGSTISKPAFLRVCESVGKTS